MYEEMRKSVKIIKRDYKADEQYVVARDYVEKHIGEIGVIMDISDAHGLSYGVVFPNTNGEKGRHYYFEIYWFEPTEVEIL